MEVPVPYIALAISVVSLLLSVYVALRDRGRLRARCRAYRHPETGEYAFLQVSVVNVGRRPIILRYLYGRYEGGRVAGVAVDGEPLTLSEGAHYETKIGKFDGMMVYTDEYDGVYANLVRLFVEDSTGNRYRVRGSKKQVQLLWGSKHKLGIRTH